MNRTLRFLTGLLIGLVAVAGLALGAATPAAADTGPGGAVIPVPMVVPMDASSCGATNEAGSDLLSVNRWGGATGTLHNRFGSMPWDDFGGKIDRTQSTMWMQIGNMTFGLAAQIVEGATRFCVLDTVGAPIDQAAGKVGKALLDSPLLAIGVGIGLTLLVWSRMRGSGTVTIGTIVKKVVIVGVLIVMVAGAAKSTTAADGTFSPGPASPGWFVTKVDKVVSAVAAAPVAEISKTSRWRVKRVAHRLTLSSGWSALLVWRSSPATGSGWRVGLCRTARRRVRNGNSPWPRQPRLWLSTGCAAHNVFSAWRAMGSFFAMVMLSCAFQRRTGSRQILRRRLGNCGPRPHTLCRSRWRSNPGRA